MQSMPLEKEKDILPLKRQMKAFNSGRNVRVATSKMVVCRIIDDGEGMNKKDLQNIFKPFFTTKPQGKGIGLGLFIVR